MLSPAKQTLYRVAYIGAKAAENLPGFSISTNETLKAFSRYITETVCEADEEPPSCHDAVCRMLMASWKYERAVAFVERQLAGAHIHPWNPNPSKALVSVRDHFERLSHRVWDQLPPVKEGQKSRGLGPGKQAPTRLRALISVAPYPVLDAMYEWGEKRDRDPERTARNGLWDDLLEHSEHLVSKYRAKMGLAASDVMTYMVTKRSIPKDVAELIGSLVSKHYQQVPIRLPRITTKEQLQSNMADVMATIETHSLAKSRAHLKRILDSIPDPEFAQQCKKIKAEAAASSSAAKTASAEKRRNLRAAFAAAVAAFPPAVDTDSSDGEEDEPIMLD